MTLYGNTIPLRAITDGLKKTMMMSESSTLAQISAYVAENMIISTPEAISQKMMVVEATSFEDVINK